MLNQSVQPAGPGVALYEAVSESVTERVLREDETHSTGLTMFDPDILVPNEP